MPHACFICGSTNKVQGAICSHCNQQSPWRAHHCISCYRSIQGEPGQRCGQCLKTPPPWCALYAPFYYTGIIKRMVAQFKYQQQHWMGHWLADRLYQHLVTRPRECWPDALVPVPIHKRRLGRRGFNQSLILSKVLASRLHLPTNTVRCHRVLATAPQHSMNKSQRHYNVKQAFTVTGPCPPHIAIIDDICTTGSTLAALAAPLKAQGAMRIEAWCVATSTP